MKKYLLPIFLIAFWSCEDANDTDTDTEPLGVYIYNVVSTPTDSESITLKNNSSSYENISGWTLGDKNEPNAYNIPMDTILEAMGKKTFPRSTLGFQINDSGETIYLRDSNDSLIDTWNN